MEINKGQLTNQINTNKKNFENHTAIHLLQRPTKYKKDTGKHKILQDILKLKLNDSRNNTNHK